MRLQIRYQKICLYRLHPRPNLRLSPSPKRFKALSDKGTAAVVVIADTPGYPPLLVAPENRWALVNVAALGGAGVTAETLADRTRRSSSALGYLMGAAKFQL